jgi:outer membrane protein assembly factor BamC
MMRWVGAVAVLLTAMLSGCVSDLLGPDQVDYKAAKKLPPLDIPPDLTTPATDDRNQIPDVAAAGATTYSAYSAERTSTPRSDSTGVLPTFDNVRLERSGSERWLVVSAPPEQVWPIVKEFWQESGFLIKTESPETGVMETDWNEKRAKVPQEGIRSLMGKVFDSTYSTAERDKFRTRLERGEKPGTTEIYISHRGVEEVYITENRDDTRWQPRPPDPGLETEFLRKLMLRFGLPNERAKTLLAAKPKEEDGRAKVVAAADGVGSLELAEPFDRAWRRVGLALDRGGFTVEDRDRSKGYYFVRYVDSDAEALKKDDGFLSKLAFWRSSEPGKSEQYRVLVKDRNDSSEVQVLDKAGNPEHSDTARKILALLQSQLK